MATARETALQSLRDMWYSQGQIDSAMAQVRNQQAKGQTASQIKSNVQSNSSSYFWGSAMYGSWGSSSSSSAWGSWLTNKDTSSNTNAWDIYWDVWGNRTWATPMDFSNASWTINESSLKFWKNAAAEQAKSKDYLANRNNEIASYLYALNKDKWGEVDRNTVKWYLDKFKDFTDAEEWEQNNTIDAILARYGEVKKEKEKTDTWVTWVDETSLNDINWDWKADKAWFYSEDGEYVKAYWYDGLSQEYKDLFDRLPENKKKEISNYWAQALQEYLKQYDASMREKEQAEARWKLTDDLHNIEKESWQIQADQTIRNAEQSYENLKQNWQYLWNMGMPGTSATKIQAIGDALTEARTTLEEVKRLTNLKSDAMAKQWDAQVLNYSQQIDNLMYDLRWKIGQEAIDALSKYTTAELEGKLDTIDWVTAFRREILDELDTNLSGITSASLTQMQAINKEYQDIADKMYEYSKNANVVNKDMSSVLWYYVDGNGNAIINAEWKPIQVPPTAPIDPVFDKETGKLITFATDENWNIVASVQQVWNNPSSSFLSSFYGNWGSGNSWYLDIPRNVNWFKDNVWADTNNFWNITSAVWGSIGMYKSPNGRSYAVFANAQDWYNALVNDIKAKQSWNSRTWLNGNSTIEELMWVWVNGGGSVNSSHRYAKDFYSATWLKPGTKIWTVDANLLAKGIMAGEWTLAAYNKGWVDLSSYANQWTNYTWGSQYPAELERLFNKKDLVNADYEFLEKNWISRWDFAEMRKDYLNSQGSASNLWKWMGSVILDSLYVSDDNNATQNQNYWFASRAWKADDALKELEKDFYWWWNHDRPEWMKSSKHKDFDTYKEAFINARLRKESWANITDSEFAKAEKFFPKAWDSEENIKSKQKLRESIIDWLFQSSWKDSNWTQFVEIYRNNKDKVLLWEWNGETVVEEEEDIPEWNL